MAASLIAFVGSAIFPIYPYVAFIRDAPEKRLAASERRVRDADVQVEQVRAAYRKLPQFREEVARLDMELAKLRKILPSAASAEDSFGQTIADTAVAHAVNVVSVTAQPVEERENYLSRPHEVVVGGDLASLAAFFHHLSNRPIIIYAPRVALQHGEKTWTATARLVSFSAE